MCLGIPGEVSERRPEQPDLAKVNVSGVRRMINIGLLSDDPPAPGEWVLIHVGFALSKIDEQEAAATMQFLEGTGQAYEDELAALKASVIEEKALGRMRFVHDCRDADKAHALAAKIAALCEPGRQYKLMEVC